MAVHMLKAVQKIPGSIAEVWNFFADPGNLARITPTEMDFRIISEKHEGGLYPGQVIEYTVKPLLGISFYWMTEITQVRDQAFFIDEQRRGPYSLWHHQHHFEQVEGGVKMTDLVHYSNPLGFLGEIANVMLVRKKLRDLFEYRVGRIEEQFGSWDGGTVTMR